MGKRPGIAYGPVFELGDKEAGAEPRVGVFPGVTGCSSTPEI